MKASGVSAFWAKLKELASRAREAARVEKKRRFMRFLSSCPASARLVEITLGVSFGGTKLLKYASSCRCYLGLTQVKFGQA
jgi:hypothetical protein